MAGSVFYCAACLGSRRHRNTCVLQRFVQFITNEDPPLNGGTNCVDVKSITAGEEKEPDTTFSEAAWSLHHYASGVLILLVHSVHMEMAD